MYCRAATSFKCVFLMCSSGLVQSSDIIQVCVPNVFPMYFQCVPQVSYRAATSFKHTVDAFAAIGMYPPPHITCMYPPPHITCICCNRHVSSSSYHMHVWILLLISHAFAAIGMHPPPHITCMYPPPHITCICCNRHASSSSYHMHLLQ